MNSSSLEKEWFLAALELTVAVLRVTTESPVGGDRENRDQGVDRVAEGEELQEKGWADPEFCERAGSEVSSLAAITC